MAKALPNFALMTVYYPTDPDPQKVKQQIGRDVDQEHYHNTCIIRISRAMNYVGHPIPADTALFRTKQGADGKWYGLRVKEFREYMELVYGKPTLLVRRKKNKPISPDEFNTRRGIICLEIDGLSDATGHFSLWDGNRMLYGDPGYFARAREVALWADVGWSQAPV